MAKEESQEVVQFSFLALILHLGGVAILFHAHLVIKLCLVNMLEIVPGIGDVWQWRQQVAAMTF